MGPMGDVRHIRPVVVTCACGAAYDREAWRKLEFVGIQLDETNDAELRNCVACGSTRALIIEPDLIGVVVLLNETAKRLNVVTARLADTAENGIKCERERCAKIADEFASRANLAAHHFAELPSMAEQQNQIAQIAERIAKRIRGSK
jgi:hypothetical protein